VPSIEIKNYFGWLIIIIIGSIWRSIPMICGLEISFETW